MAENYSIKIGGNVTNSPIAMGNGASAGGSISSRPAKECISVQLDDLIAALEQYGIDESGLSNIRAVAASVKNEAAADQPDKGQIQQYLEQIKSLIKNAVSVAVSAGGVAAAIESIRATVEHL